MKRAGIWTWFWWCCFDSILMNDILCVSNFCFMLEKKNLFYNWYTVETREMPSFVRFYFMTGSLTLRKLNNTSPSWNSKWLSYARLKLDCCETVWVISSWCHRGLLFAQIYRFFKKKIENHQNLYFHWNSKKQKTVFITE